MLMKRGANDSSVVLIVVIVIIIIIIIIMWEPSMGISHKLPNHYRGNGYANRYPSNSPINRISMETNNRNSTCIVASGVYTWVRLKTTTEIYMEDSSVSYMTRMS
jgi:uncharacterized membrane protein